MGYTHYWSRPAIIPQTVFHAIRIDFESLILPLSDGGTQLAGAGGEGPPEITEELICFNGLNNCGHPKTTRSRFLTHWGTRKELDQVRRL